MTPEPSLARPKPGDERTPVNFSAGVIEQKFS
jgi:hypothetical protein